MAKGKLETIRDIYQREQEKGDDGHPLREVWKWAEDGKTTRDRSERFEALSAWARKKEREADEKDIRKLWDANAESYRERFRFLDEKADKAAKKRQEEDEANDGPITSFDGKPVTKDWAVVLQMCRDTGLWHGGLNSGYRSPAYSTQLCIQICGSPTCPGRCAGASSNHSKSSIPAGAAVDVSDPAGFRQALIRIGRSELHNALGAADPWHFSISGR
jgi:hypothetical protein